MQSVEIFKASGHFKRDQPAVIQPSDIACSEEIMNMQPDFPISREFQFPGET
jgi:hypothetical protein